MTKLILSGVVVFSLFLLVLTTNRVSSGSVIEEQNERSSELPKAENSSVETARSRYTLPRVFDFQRFKRVFKRVYDSLLEEMARKRLFLARAFQAFISAVFYKQGYRSSYLAINGMSDWTPDEVDRLYLDGDEVLGKLKAAFQDLDFEDDYESRNQEDFIPAMDEEGIERNFEIIGENKDKPGFRGIIEELAKTKFRREKRGTDSRSSLDIDDIFREPFTTEAQMSEKVPSNNPNYVVPELRSFGEVKRSGLASFMPSNLAFQIMSMPGAGLAANLIGGISTKFFAPSRPTTSPEVELTASDELRPRNDLPLPDDGISDEIFIDHRGSNCLQEVRRQSSCGACYVFATIALYEYTYCKQTGKRVAFSEQYVVDCGKTVGMNGCVSGLFSLVPDFVTKYGLELRENYPYLAREDQCPYEFDQIEDNPAIAGYIRVGEQNFRGVRIELVELFLRVKPMVVNVAVNDVFHQYGGGVSELKDCVKTRVHSMLLIGSGREDGQEYWLFRNSHGDDWGEQGHYKLSKKSDCITPKAGFLLVADSDIKFSHKQEEKQ